MLDPGWVLQENVTAHLFWLFPALHSWLFLQTGAWERHTCDPIQQEHFYVLMFPQGVASRALVADMWGTSVSLIPFFSEAAANERALDLPTTAALSVHRRGAYNEGLQRGSHRAPDYLRPAVDTWHFLSPSCLPHLCWRWWWQDCGRLHLCRELCALSGVPEFWISLLWRFPHQQPVGRVSCSLLQIVSGKSYILL